jgi:hypothetical protein
MRSYGHSAVGLVARYAAAKPPSGARGRRSWELGVRCYTRRDALSTAGRRKGLSGGAGAAASRPLDIPLGVGAPRNCPERKTKGSAP